MAVNRYDDTRAWYTISTYSGYEDKVADSIKQRLGSPELDGKIFDAIGTKIILKKLTNYDNILQGIKRELCI